MGIAFCRLSREKEDTKRCEKKIEELKATVETLRSEREQLHEDVSEKELTICR